MIPANHFDHDAAVIKQTNYMINILPQVDKLNRGAWLQTEMIVECLRDREPLRVLGGAVYPSGDYAAKHWFRKTHGVLTPAFFWKIIAASPSGMYAADHGILAFWMPNSAEAVARDTARYVVSLRQLEANLTLHGGIGEVFNATDAVKDHVPSYWGTLEGCDRA
jgi:DNA/RNA endonuclease G (NUC1)